MYNVDVHPNVYAEMEHSRAWYEQRAEDLGTEFLVEVERAIQMVRDSPLIWPFRNEDRGIRRYLVHRFPYGVVYRVSNQIIQVIAVMHLRRHPDYWQGRVQHWNGEHAEQPTTT
ncbi:MAG: type II toxin-antitoxin system RelE/ParE family toxin [Lentisphaerae bacterium]|nr:type II toxin-antitoxin system RelE/ParE family toxin [Lentisphaerota bacterium]